MGLPQFKPKLIESFQTMAHNYIPFSAAKSIYLFFLNPIIVKNGKYFSRVWGWLQIMAPVMKTKIYSFKESKRFYT